ncbi:MAG: cysteine--tRNA ligase [Syntrophales bacterium]
MKIYNTATRKKEEFIALREGHAGMYVCGITAYDACHMGHARSAVVFDIIRRYLEYRGYQVTYVKNFTDVDDKIIQRANAEGSTIFEIAERFIQLHNEDMDTLGVGRPTIAPRATEHIEGMIRLIQTLLDKGLAYKEGADVYFSVGSYPPYGKLSRRNIEDMMAGARVDINERKRNPLDFALWKASKTGEPAWESPWGPGRPGWHIECSVMSRQYLGESFDIHGGGEDLIFPHHENEIAQSEGATGKPLARYWIHNGFIRVNSEKMSKSLGNFFTIKDVLQSYHPEVLRFFLMQSHYRSPVDYSDGTLREARIAMERFYSCLKAIKDELPDKIKSSQSHELVKKIAGCRERFIEAMDDDFNTPRALGYMFDAVRMINGFLAEGHGVSMEKQSALYEARRVLLELGHVLGILHEDPDEYLCRDREREALRRNIDEQEIEKLIAERVQARQNKEWKRADEIRWILAEKGIVLQDGPEGTTWRAS